jgi:putative sterol carrier protein
VPTTQKTRKTPKHKTKAGAAADPTKAFFDDLTRREREPLLRRASGTLRIDLADGKTTHHWYVTLKKGAIVVSHKEGTADAIVRADKSLFDDLAGGRANAMAATLRGTLRPEGDLGLMMSFQRLFPSPPTTGRRAGDVRLGRSAR